MNPKDLAAVPLDPRREQSRPGTGPRPRCRSAKSTYPAPKLQKQDLPLIAKQRPLRSWERPWPIEP